MPTATRAAVAIATGALALSLAATATPASAVPPHAEEVPDIAAVFPDFGNNLVGFLNFSRAGFCAWEAGGFAGPPPFLETTSAWLRVNGNGEVRGTGKGELPLDLWPMDADAAGDGPCADTDDAAEQFAAGRADVRVQDVGLFETDDGHGAYRATLALDGVLSSPAGDDYRYHAHVIELVDAQGRVRHPDSAHFRLVELP